MKRTVRSLPVTCLQQVPEFESDSYHARAELKAIKRNVVWWKYISESVDGQRNIGVMNVRRIISHFWNL
jgi:hypothetical protein